LAGRQYIAVLLGFATMSGALGLWLGSANAQAPASSSSPVVADDLKGPPIHSLNDYLGGADEISPLGMTLYEGQVSLSDGHSVRGLVIARIIKGGPASAAGLREPSATASDVILGAAMVASFVFPPAMLAVPVIAAIPSGKQGDVVIAVDASRVRNILDFENLMQDVQPGEIVYLTIIRSGKRLQIPVPMPGLPGMTTILKGEGH
jgi:S1-C subfamily serine protease